MANQVITASDGKVSVIDPSGKVVYSYYPGGTSPSSSGTTSKTYTQGDPYYSPTGEYQGIVNYDAQTGKKLSAGQTTTQLTPVSAPTNASNISATPSLNYPTLSPYMSTVSPALASTAGAKSFADTNFQIAQDQANFEQKLREQIAKTESGKQEQSFLQKLLGTQSPSEVRQDAFKQTGIDPQKYFADQKAKIAEIEKMEKEYNQVKADRDQQIAQSYDKYATNSFINNQQAQIERNAAPRLNQISADINAKTATLQALQGNFAEAQRFVNEAIEAVTADQRYNMQMYGLLKDYNEELFNQISEPYAKAYDAHLNMLETEYKRTYEEKQQVGSLMIDNPNAGILITDSLDQALSKVAASGGSLEARREVRLGKEGAGGTGAEQDLREDYVSYLDDGYTEAETIQRLKVLYPEFTESKIRSIISGSSTSSDGFYGSQPVDIQSAISSGGLIGDFSNFLFK